MKSDLFEKDGMSWNALDSCYVNIDNQDVPAARREIRKLVDSLGDCRIAAGPEISGVLYRELDSRGFSIFQIAQLNTHTLDGILADLEAADELKKDMEGVHMSPVETETPGVYFLDLIKLQKAYPEISSKAALGGFFQHQPFFELKLICAHMPLWLEEGPYEISTRAAPDGAVAAVIRKRQC